MQHKIVQLYMCPTPGCPDYYGTNGMPDLHEQFTGPRVENRALQLEKTGSAFSHSRAQCPTCRAAGRTVERVLVTVPVPVPEPVEALPLPRV